MITFEKNKIIHSGKTIKEFEYQIRNMIEIDDLIIILLEIPFGNTTKKNNIVAINLQGNVVWTVDASEYVKNALPFEQMFLKDNFLYASDFYARKFKINYEAGIIEDMSVSK